jgi:hypothetical protein
MLRYLNIDAVWCGRPARSRGGVPLPRPGRMPALRRARRPHHRARPARSAFISIGERGSYGSSGCQGVMPDNRRSGCRYRRLLAWRLDEGQVELVVKGVEHQFQAV